MSEQLEFDCGRKEVRFPKGSHSEVQYFDKNSEFPFQIHLNSSDEYYVEVLPSKRKNCEHDLMAVVRIWYSNHCPGCEYVGICGCHECPHTQQYLHTNGAGSTQAMKFVHPVDTENDDNGNAVCRLHYQIVDAKLVPKPHHAQFNDNLEKCYNEKLFMDFKIEVDGKILLASKFILSSNSDVFKSMAGPSFQEGTSNSMKIDDFSYETVKAFLDCLHSGGKVFPSEGLEELCLITDKYNVGFLMERCIKDLCCTVSDENFIQRTIFAYKLGNERLMKEMIEFASKNERFKTLLKSKQFSECAEENSSIMVQMSCDLFCN